MERLLVQCNTFRKTAGFCKQFLACIVQTSEHASFRTTFVRCGLNSLFDINFRACLGLSKPHVRRTFPQHSESYATVCVRKGRDVRARKESSGLARNKKPANKTRTRSRQDPAVPHLSFFCSAPVFKRERSPTHPNQSS